MLKILTQSLIDSIYKHFNNKVKRCKMRPRPDFRKDLKAAEEMGASYSQLNALWKYATQEDWQRFYSLLNQIAGGQK